MLVLLIDCVPVFSLGFMVCEMIHNCDAWSHHVPPLPEPKHMKGHVATCGSINFELLALSLDSHTSPI